MLATPEQRLYRTRIRNGVSIGSDVWTGNLDNQVGRKGPNFAGHFFVIRWGCGSQCVMMATVDAETGQVFEPPLSEKGSLWVPLDNLSDMEIDLRPDSSLLFFAMRAGISRAGSLAASTTSSGMITASTS